MQSCGHMVRLGNNVDCTLQGQFCEVEGPELQAGICQESRNCRVDCRACAARGHMTAHLPDVGAQGVAQDGRDRRLQAVEQDPQRVCRGAVLPGLAAGLLAARAVRDWLEDGLMPLPEECCRSAGECGPARCCLAGCNLLRGASCC